MPFKAKYIFVASMDVDPNKEDLFNEVYDTEHVPSSRRCRACTGSRGCRASRSRSRSAAR